MRIEHGRRKWMIRNCGAAPRAAKTFSAASKACATLTMFCASILSAATPEYTYKVIHVYPHDRTSFTEGLEYHGGFLYESTGEKGQSVLRKLKLETGEVVQEIKIPT